MEMSTIGLMNGIAHEFEEGIELDELGETEGNPNSGPQEIRRKSMKLEDLDMETIDEEKETESVNRKFLLWFISFIFLGSFKRSTRIKGRSF